MMKITLFVFAVLLVAVVFAAPKPEGEEVKDVFNLEDIKKLFDAAQEQLKSAMSPENTEKLKDNFSTVGEELKKAGAKLQETLEGLMKEATKKTENSN